MAQQGYIKLYRQLQENWLWQEKRVFSKAEAWIDLLFVANHKESKVVFGTSLMTVSKGSRITSIRQLCDRWKWSNTKVVSFLELLQTDGMITYKSDTKKTVVSIVNWDLYQCSDDTETSQKHIKNTSNQYQKHTNNNDKNDKNEKKDIYTPEFEEWYKSWPRSEAKADSFKNFEKRRKEHGLDFILQCSKNYIDYYSSLPKGSLAYQSNNFFGQKAYYTDYIEPKAYKPEKPISKVQQALDRMT